MLFPKEIRNLFKRCSYKYTYKPNKSDMKNININKAEAQKQLQALEAEVNKLKAIINKPEKLTDIVTSWEKYLEYTQQDEDNLLPFNNPKTKRQRRLNADVKLELLIELFNEGWVPNWDNSNEYKYFPYFDMRTQNGFAFRYTSCDYWHTSSDVGSGFVLKSSELAEFMGRTFLSEYKDKMGY